MSKQVTMSIYKILLQIGAEKSTIYISPCQGYCVKVKGQGWSMTSWYTSSCPFEKVSIKHRLRIALKNMLQ